jgi:hypothetical protein
MTGRHSGVIKCIHPVAPDATWIDCSIHREVLAAKLDSLKDVLDTTVKMVNFVKARPLNSYVFSALCNDMLDKIEAMIKKLELFSVYINKANTQVFPSLYDFFCANELKLTDNFKCDIT